MKTVREFPETPREGPRAIVNPSSVKYSPNTCNHFRAKYGTNNAQWDSKNMDNIS